ncbi:MAG: hypothetical protein IJA85_02850 [Clostridia bacterium]|nr:hypothetical protein [Clostridia bacterium]
MESTGVYRKPDVNDAEALYAEKTCRPPFHDDYYPMCRFPAECLVKSGRNDKAINLLEEGVAIILSQKENYNQKKTLDVPLLRDCSFGYGHDGNTEYRDHAGKLRRFVQCDTFKVIKDNPRYRALAEKITGIKS